MKTMKINIIYTILENLYLPLTYLFIVLRKEKDQSIHHLHTQFIKELIKLILDATKYINCK